MHNSQFFIPESSLSRHVSLIKISSCEFLREKYRLEEFLYSPDQNSNAFSQVVLNFDWTSIKIQKPSGTLAESMEYFDGKNWIYALKVEVATTNTDRPVPIFISPSYPGSTHDVNIHRKFTRNYHKFLQIQTQHSQLLHSNFRTSPTYYIMADKGYIVAGTGYYYEIPFKNPNPSQQLYNQIIGQVRVRIEQFFFRMKSSWKLTQKVYPNQRESFDHDINNCIYLTNIVSTRDLLSRADIIQTEETSYIRSDNSQSGNISGRDSRGRFISNNFENLNRNSTPEREFPTLFNLDESTEEVIPFLPEMMEDFI